MAKERSGGKSPHFTRLEEVLGRWWYSQQRAASGRLYFEDLSHHHFPGDFIIKPEVISIEPFSTRDPAYRSFSVESARAEFEAIEPESTIELFGLRLDKQRSNRLDLIHPHYPLRFWVDLEAGQVDVPALKREQPLYLRRRVAGHRQKFLADIVRQVFTDPQWQN